MDAAESKSSSDTDGPIEIQLLNGTVRFGSHTTRRNLVESSAAKTLEGSIRALVRGNGPVNDGAEPAPEPEPHDDVVIAGAIAIADIEKLIEELLVARDYLQAEGERVRQVNARYGHLAQTASTSAKIITDSIGRWHNPEPERATRLNDAALRLSPAPSLNPVDDGEAKPKEPMSQV